MEFALELKNITKIFGKTVANKNINLSVKKGEILSLLLYVTMQPLTV